MRKILARRALAAFARRYDTDTAYAEHMLDTAPGTFFRFFRAMRITYHRERVPARAARAAAIAATLHEDCGPCTHITVAMAREAGLPDAEIEAVLTDDTEAMTEETACAVRFARALVEGRADRHAARDTVRARWGEAGVVDLTIATQFSRLYPMLKAGLGYDQTCRQVTVGDRTVVPHRPADIGARAA